MTGVQQKYSLADEVAYYSGIIGDGLEPWEESLLRQYLKKQDRILDVGCGAGREALALTGMGYKKIYGLDLAYPMIAEAKKQAQKRKMKITFVRGNVMEGIPDPLPPKYDAVLMIAQMMCHIPKEKNRLRLLENIFQALVPNGWVILSTHNRYDGTVTRWQWRMQSCVAWVQRLMGVSGLEPGDILSPTVSTVNSPGMAYMHIFEPGEMSTLLEAVGFRIEKIASNTEIVTGRVDMNLRYKDSYVFYVAQKPGPE